MGFPEGLPCDYGEEPKGIVLPSSVCLRDEDAPMVESLAAIVKPTTFFVSSADVYCFMLIK